MALVGHAQLNESSIDQSQNPLESIVQQNNTLTGFNFTNQSNLLSSQSPSTVYIVGIADMDGDKLDDIVRFQNGNSLVIEYQTRAPHFENVPFGGVASDFELTLAIADVDENGFNDIIVGGDNDGVKLLLANDDGTAYTQTVLPDSDFLVQGSNFADIDNDGLVDVFVCDDSAASKIWRNTGDGLFEPANNLVNMDLYPNSDPDDNAGNYSSAWTDFDNDGDLDLYISKCHADAVDLSDPRKINQLFVNENSLDTFIERSSEFGLNLDAQSWTSDFQDIDNDGDLDCFVVNHYEACQLLENDGTGHFTDITMSSGLDIVSNPLQAILRDFNNDGFIDILVAGASGHEVYENNGNSTFSELDQVFNGFEMDVFAIGDLNYDGFLDIYAGNTAALGNDALWINEKNQNNYLAVNLESTTGNLNAIGSRIEIYGEWGIQVREVRSGESYGIMNSFTQYFGLGEATQIDSLVVRWPSGNVENFNNPLSNQVLNIVENECAYPGGFIFTDEGTSMCEGDTLRLRAPAGSSFNWSNGGANAQDALILSPGIYQVTVSNDYGCTTVSDSVTINLQVDEVPVIDTLGQTTLCLGSTVILKSSPGEAYLWSNGQQSQNIIVFQSGSYSVTTFGLCEENTSEPVVIEVIPAPATPMVENDTIESVPQSGVLTATGDNIIWYANQSSIDDTLGMGSPFVTLEILETTSFYARDEITVNGVSCRSLSVEALVVLDSTTAIQEVAASNLFLIYPNPTGDFLVVESKGVFGDEVVLRMINVSGQLVFKTAKIQIQDKIQINTAGLESGIYSLMIETEEDIFYKKVIVQR